jgi:hypothetical protein
MKARSQDSVILIFSFRFVLDYGERLTLAIIAAGP